MGRERFVRGWLRKMRVLRPMHGCRPRSNWVAIDYTKSACWLQWNAANWHNVMLPASDRLSGSYHPVNTHHGRTVGGSNESHGQLTISARSAFPVMTSPKLRVPVVSGKPHRKMPPKVVLLKGLRIRCEVSGNLIFSAPRMAHGTLPFQSKIRTSGEFGKQRKE
jgi:hypothetical protein